MSLANPCTRSFVKIMKSSLSTKALEPADIMQEFCRTSPIEQDDHRWGKLHTMMASKGRPDTSLDLPTLTKAELASMLFEQLGLTKREAKAFAGGALRRDAMDECTAQAQTAQ